MNVEFVGNCKSYAVAEALACQVNVGDTDTPVAALAGVNKVTVPVGAALTTNCAETVLAPVVLLP